MELVDIGDSKSPALKSVPVRVRPLVPNKKPRLARGGVFYLVLVVGEIDTPGSTNCERNLDAERSEGACEASVKSPQGFSITNCECNLDAERSEGACEASVNSHQGY